VCGRKYCELLYDDDVVKSLKPLVLRQNDENYRQRQKRQNCIKRVFLELIPLDFIVFVIVGSLVMGYICNGIDAFLRRVQENPAPGIFLFTLIYFVAMLEP
jgi:hypothetical protein